MVMIICIRLVIVIDGGLILGGSSSSTISGDKTVSSLGQDYWLIKIDSIGNIQWQNSIGGSGSEQPYSVFQTSDGGFIIGGDSYSGISGDKTQASRGDNDYWVVKTDASGNIEWDKTFGGSSVDFLHGIAQAADGGYFLCGESYSVISGDKTENKIGPQRHMDNKIKCIWCTRVAKYYRRE
ncbi:MAG: hypothetical protein V9F05_12780 [Chitinophagaceae bacterium]